ncbi:uncharacterized protein [Hetaerina americana]|uniref:uncharacterized protein n=1 Tax=Hetaerina americana TaxID=62018 RepID=UPI003A7F5C95
MKGQNPFPAILIVLLVVSLAGAQQLQRGFVAAQGRPGAATSLHRERGSTRVDGGAGSVGATAAFRTQQQQFRPVNRVQVQQRANKIPASPQDAVNIGQQRVSQQPTQQPFTTSQRIVHVVNTEQQQVTNDQQRLVQIPVAAQPQQVTTSQQRPTQVPRSQQQAVSQRVVQIPSSQVNLSHQRAVQFANPQQPSTVTQPKEIQIPSSQQQQQFAGPPTNNREFLQSDVKSTTRDSQGNNGFTQDAFPTQENTGVTQPLPIPSPLPVQRKKVRKQRVRNNNNGIGTFPDDLTDEELEAKRELEEVLHEQARNAHYHFSSTVEDGLNDQTVSRKETRDGLLTKGSYSYSDGFFLRTVHYEADENGYRVISQEIQSIGDGPQPDPNGTAHVANEFGNARNEYAITAADLAPAEEEIIDGSI